MKALFRLWPLWLITFLFASFMALTSFINSSMLIDVFGISEAMLGVLYSFGSFCALASVLILPRFFNYHTTVKTLLTSLLLLGAVSTLGLIAIPQSPLLGSILFICYLIASAAVLYLLDIIVGHYSTPQNTGVMRGWYMTIISIAWVIAPFVSGYLTDRLSGYTVVYIIAGILMVIAGAFALSTHDNFTPREAHTSTGLLGNMKSFLQIKNLRNIFLTNTLLQTFYAVMVIYSPIYLNEVVGLSWEHIGIIFAIMLTAFVILSYPLGYIADVYLGEKEILTAGLLIMSITTLAIPFMPQGLHWTWWALLMFGTRVGAAATEMMNESFFFKHVTNDEVSYIAYYRNARPLSYIAAPLVMSFFLGIFKLETQHIFIILAVMVGLGVFWSLGLEDTK